MGVIRYIEDDLYRLVVAHQDAIYELEDIWSKITKNVGLLESAWEGESATAFFEDFYSMEVPIQKMIEIIQQEGEYVDRMRQEMMDVEQQIISQIPQALGD